jgi:tetratricopeptide (TPR) repeat protein
MSKRNLFSLAALVVIIAVVGVILTRKQIGPSAGLALFSRATPTPAPPDFITQGNDHLAQSQFDLAYNAYNAAINAKENLSQAYAGRGDVYAQWRRFREAAQDYSTSLEMQRDPVVLSKRCNMNRLLAKFDQAHQDCQEAIQADPKYIDGYVSLAVLYLEQGKGENASETIDQAMAIDSTTPSLYYARGQIEISQGHTDAGIEALSEAIRLDPNQPQFYWDRGFAYYTTGKLEEASKDMKQVIAHGNPDKDGELIYQAGSLLASLEGALNP